MNNRAPASCFAMLLAVLVGVALGPAGSVPAAAAGSVWAANDAASPPTEDRLRDERAEIFGRMTEAERERAAILGALFELQQQIRETELRREKLAGEVAAVSKNLVAVQGELTTLEQRREYLRGLAGRRVRILYERGQVAYLEVLLGSTNFSDFLTRFNVIQNLLEYDVRLLKENQRVAREVREKKEELETVRAHQTAEQEALERTRLELGALAAEKEERLKALKGDRERYEKELAALDRAWYEKGFPALRGFFQNFGLLSSHLVDLAFDVRFTSLQPLSAAITVRDQDLNAFLQKTNPDWRDLQFITKKGRVQIRGESGGYQLVILGSLVPRESDVELLVGDMFFDGLPVSPLTRESLLKDARLTLEPSGLPFPVVVKEVRMEPGEMVIVAQHQ